MPERPPLVGRREVMSQLREGMARAAAGDGGALLLTGEAGIGKTRLGEEAAKLARGSGFRVVTGRAGPGEQSLPYTLVLESFGTFLRGLEPGRRRSVTAGLSSLGRLFSDLDLPQPSSLGDPALEKTQLFAAVARLMERLAREAPLFLFLDDLHWADAASLELTLRLSRGLAGRPVLLLGTWRPREAEARRELRLLMPEVRRGGAWAEEVAVAPLDPEAAASMVAGLLEGEVPEPVRRHFATRSGGWPLFVEALVRTARGHGQLAARGGVWYLSPERKPDLPSELREVVRERLERLEDAERAVLELAAVAGRDATLPVLIRAGGLTEEASLAVLERLEGVGLLEEALRQGGVAYVFTHPLFQEEVYAGLTEAVRQRRHLAVAQALEAVVPEDVAAVGRHYAAAGPAARGPRALRAILAAAEDAWRMHAHEEAARHWQAALELARGEGSAELVAQILERLGEAWALMGEAAAAATFWEETLNLHRARENAAGAARLCRRLAWVEWDLGRTAAARAHIAEGLALAREGPAAPEQAELQHARAVLSRRRGDLAELGAAALELTGLAGALGSARCSALAHLAHAALCLARGEFADALAHALRGMEAAREAEDLLLAVRAKDVAGLLAFAVGDHLLCRRLGEEGVILARQLELPPAQTNARVHLALAAFLAGDWDEAGRQAVWGVSLARQYEMPRLLAVGLGVQGMLSFHRGDDAAAAACAREAGECYHAEGSGGEYGGPAAATVQALLHLVRGEAGIALELTRPFLTQPAMAISPLCLAVLVEASVAVGEWNSAAQGLWRLESFGAAGNPYAAALALRGAAQLRRAAGEGQDAAALLEQAQAAFTAMGLPFEAARARCEWATQVLEDRPAAAKEAATESCAVFTEMGARRQAAVARQILRRLGARLPGPRRRGPLSLRELEVARLVAQGLTNAQIAARLTLSTRTVENHLQRVYRRLGLPSRAALARYLAERGLTEDLEQPGN